MKSSHPIVTLALPLLFALLFSGCKTPGPKPEKEIRRPNVVLIMTDDQGYGDLGYHGNHHIKTPVLDSLAEASIRFNNFHVSPVCAPTRSSLLTGRYSLRTGVRDTYNGGAIMSTEEITIAEMLKDAGYTTGVFGKWHLGDNYPSRPMDQGFDESVIHLSGGMGQVGDFTTYFEYDSSYFNPILWHNGEQQAYQGYCSDIFADQAIRFIGEHSDGPFFCYLAFNAPHTPLQVPEEYYGMYADIDPAEGFDPLTMPKMTEKNREDARRVYAMVTNIDDNVGKLINQLKSQGIMENTILIFMTDNGPQQPRYIAGMRGRKGSVYRGGVRVPFFFSYAERYAGNSDIDDLHAHIDVLPTLAKLCKAELPADRIIDGISMVPALEGEDTAEERSLFFYWTRKYPEIYRNIAFQSGNMKIVANADQNAETGAMELYDLEKDPGESDTVMNEHQGIGQALRDSLDHYITELTSEENLLDQPPIIIGSPAENPVCLNRNDASGERGIWNQEDILGYWNVQVHKGTYDVSFRFIEPVEKGTLFLDTGGKIFRQENNKTTDTIVMNNIAIQKFKGRILPFYMEGNRRIFPFWVKLTRTDE